MTGGGKKIVLFSAGNSRRLILAEAAILTLAFHLGLLFLFKPYSFNNVRQKDQKRAVSMFVADRDDRHGSLVRWMESGDPTLTALPDDKNGFGSLLKEGRCKFKVRSVAGAPWRGGVEENEFAGAAYEELRAEAPETTEAMLSKMERNGRASKEKADNGTPARTPSSGLCVKDIKDAALALPGAKEKIAGLVPGARTVLRISPAGYPMTPRARVEKSCGSAELDMLAEKTALAKLASGTALRDAVEILVDWNGGGAEK